MHSSSLRGYGTFDSYEGCRGLYPATSRLQSVPPTSGEFSRDIISRSRSPSPCPDAINNMNRDMIDSVNEKLHLSNMRNRFPETYRGQSSTYNQNLGRYQTSYDSPGFRYYRYDNHQEGP